MKVAITGSSGLIGSALVGSLRLDGYEVVRLVRRNPQRYLPAACAEHFVRHFLRFGINKANVAQVVLRFTVGSVMALEH